MALILAVLTKNITIIIPIDPSLHTIITSHTSTKIIIFFKGLMLLGLILDRTRFWH